MYQDNAPKNAQIGRISTGSCEAPEIRRRTQVEGQMEELDKAIYRMSELADRLENRLSPVVRQEDSSPCSEASVEPWLVPVADTMRTFAKRITFAANRLDDLFLRIEL